MPPQNRRFDSVRESTLELLRAGEQPHIEFKSAVVASSVAKQVAAGANLVAFQPAVGFHTIIFGVAEEDTHGTGATSGAIVGLTTEGGGPADLDALQLQIEQTVLARVRPQPNISIYQENVATTPILVVEVRPTSAPHVVDDRWHMRGVGGVRALTQDEALQIFKNQRLAAWIDEFQDSDPLKRALEAMRNSIDDLRFEVGQDGALPSTTAIAASLGRVEESLGGVEARVGDAIDAIEQASNQATAAAENTSTQTAESAWWSVMQLRMMRLHTVHTFASQVGAERVALLDALVSEQLGATAPLHAYPENMAELAAYRRLRQGGADRRLGMDAAADLITAVIWRRNGLPPAFGFDWLRNVQMTRDVSTDLLNPLIGRSLIRDQEPEIGLIELPGVTPDHLAEVLRGTLSLNERLLSVRLPNGVYRLAVPQSRSPWAVTFSPGTEVDAYATADLAQSVASLEALLVDSTGSSWCVEGPGLAIPNA